MHDGAGMTHDGIERSHSLHGMTRRAEFGHELVGKPTLQTQRAARFSPGTAEHPARRRDCFLQVLSEKTIPRENSGLRLRLAVSAHRAVHHRAPVREARESRIQSMEGLAARREHVRPLAAKPK